LIITARSLYRNGSGDAASRTIERFCKKPETKLQKGY
jgi:hypothetical protein